jgi:anti-anti-sigma factor
MTPVLEACTRRSILEVEGALRAPVSSRLSRRVQALLDRGERLILLDVSPVSDIDAAGVGELVRVFKSTSAAGGALRLAHASGRVRRLLQVAGLLKLMTAGTV